jgi:hypothetical protein
MHQGQWDANGFPAEIPFGAIVAVAEITDCQPVEEVMPEITVREEVWGNYGAGRFAWRLSNVRALVEPVVTIGRQGFWNLPDDVSRAILKVTPHDQ